jgi:calcineurin-like phosphoesterase family protein
MGYGDAGKKIFVISDTHFFHEKIITNSPGRPEDFHSQIIKKCKKVLCEKSLLIHLGDVIFGNKKQMRSVLKRIPGTKILVKGNHDHGHSDTFFYDAGFSFVCTQFKIKRTVFSHMPIEISDDEINIHGHFHNIPSCHWEPELVERLTDRHYLFSLELENYSPVSLNDIVHKRCLPQTINFL